jgi:hypothetical protein
MKQWNMIKREDFLPRKSAGARDTQAKRRRSVGGTYLLLIVAVAAAKTGEMKI